MLTFSNSTGNAQLHSRTEPFRAFANELQFLVSVLESIVSPCKKNYFWGRGGENVGIESRVSIWITPAFTLPWCFWWEMPKQVLFL